MWQRESGVRGAKHQHRHDRRMVAPNKKYVPCGAMALEISDLMNRFNRFDRESDARCLQRAGQLPP